MANLSEADEVVRLFGFKFLTTYDKRQSYSRGELSYLLGVYVFHEHA